MLPLPKVPNCCRARRRSDFARADWTFWSARIRLRDSRIVSANTVLPMSQEGQKKTAKFNLPDHSVSPEWSVPQIAFLHESQGSELCSGRQIVRLLLG